MEFIQIIEFKSSQFDKIQDLDREWEQATEGKRTVRRTVVTRDRDDPDRYLIVVFFDSYEEAQENSTLPETGAFADRQRAFVDGPTIFRNLDVIEDRT